MRNPTLPQLKEKNVAEGLYPIDNCDKRSDIKIFNTSKIKMTLWLEQSRFIVLVHVLSFLKVYPVHLSSSTGRRNERWHARRFTFEK